MQEFLVALNAGFTSIIEKGLPLPLRNVLAKFDQQCHNSQYLPHAVVTQKERGGGEGGWMPRPHKVFLKFFRDELSSRPPFSVAVRISLRHILT